jgi:hypothetical protein
MPEKSDEPHRTAARIGTALDAAAGGSLGLLVGVLTGLSTSPVVSITITALVALLGALFGLTEGSGAGLTTASARRLSAFGLAAAFCSVLAMWARTNDVFAPSIEHQKSVLRQIGYGDGDPAQRELLKYLQFGLVPSGMTESKNRATAKSVLYADLSSSVCDVLQRTTTTDDLVIALRTERSTRKLADVVAGLPPDKKAAAPEWVKLLLCND